MHSMNKFQVYVQALAAQFNLNLNLQYSHLTLTMPGYQELVIEKVGNKYINVAHIASDELYDPLFTFFISDTGRWVPVEQRMAFFGGRVQPVGSLAQVQDVLSFCEDIWLENLQSQGWLTGGVVKTRFNVEAGQAYWLKEAGGVAQISPDEHPLPLKQMQEFVGGYIEFLPQRMGDGTFQFIGNEEAKMVNDPVVNKLASRMTHIHIHQDVICGDVILVSEDLLAK